MRRYKHFTPAAAQRFADLVATGDQTRAEMVADVDDWCAAIWGWPLPPRALEQRNEFIHMIDANLPEETP